MKKLVFLLAILLLVACGQKNQSVQDTQDAQETQKEKPKGPFAQIEFPEGTEYSFGDYYEKVDKTHDFLVRNPGKVPLVISKVETVCPCTKAIGPEKPILEGQTDTIHVRYDGNGFPEGYFIKHITVYANIEEETVRLVISGAYHENKE